ncbi:MAG: hypothetical protein K8T10_06680 [Candidatus Eremiobacteraeota bacterium]|nr:hypothetical protein [Candidatus Eremiobacteraeota bacterium]
MLNLAKALKSSLPFKVKIYQSVCDQFKDKGIEIDPEYAHEVKDVFDSKDITGIVCLIPVEEELLALPVTYLTFMDSFPLKVRVEHYKRKRIKKVGALQ